MPLRRNAALNQVEAQLFNFGMSNREEAVSRRLRYELWRQLSVVESRGSTEVKPNSPIFRKFLCRGGLARKLLLAWLDLAAWS